MEKKEFITTYKGKLAQLLYEYLRYTRKPYPSGREPAASPLREQAREMVDIGLP